MKIAINGCGVGGPTLAWWLKKYGHQPVVFEQAPGLREGGYVIDFWGTGYDVADKMGVLPALKKDAYYIERVRSVASSGRTTSSMNVKVFSDLTDGRYFSIARSDLARSLFEALDGVEVRFGTAITGIEDRGDTVGIQLSNGGHEEVDLVVGADGLHSAVREQAFGPQDRFEHPIGFHVAAFIAEGYRPRDELVYVSHTKPHRQISRVALRDDKTLFLLVFSKQALNSRQVEGADERSLLRKVFGDMGWEAQAILSCMDEASDLYFDRVSQIRMPDWNRGRVALVGDAAACATLLAGEGTGLAMTEAYVLAGELRKAAGDHRAAFKAYQDRLHAYVTAKQDGALRFAGLFAPKNWFWLAVRDISLNLTSVPFLGKRLLASNFTSDLVLPDYEAG